MDQINDALSTANHLLYGIVTSALIAAGYSPALGFVHTGKALSFVYDIADLYKTEVVIPLAFCAIAAGLNPRSTQFRQQTRQTLTDSRLMARILPDVHQLLWAGTEQETADPWGADERHLLALWAPDQPAGLIPGGENHAA